MKRNWSEEELNRELKRFFGKEKLHKEQVGPIMDLLSGRDCLTVMPTGRGKSICFQLAGLLTPGVTVIISPLTALIQDQTKNLKKLGIPAACIYSKDDSDEESSEDISLYGWGSRRESYIKAAAGEIKFLYVTPERFSSGHFMVLLRRLPVSLLILDEAHCMSLWGHDFRHSYLEVARVIRSLPKRPVIGAFTATATKAVRRDLKDLLGLKLEGDLCKDTVDTVRKELVFIRQRTDVTWQDIAGYYRERDLSFFSSPDILDDMDYLLPVLADYSPDRHSVIMRLSQMTEEEFGQFRNLSSQDVEWRHKKRYLLDILDKHRGECGVVFCGTLDNIEIVYTNLSQIYGEDNVVKYTGPMANKDKNRSFLAFEKGNAKIMVATNAFGMGIDKRDIRFVVHYNTPRCIEDYYQEAGRAGRDENTAHCYLIYSWLFDKRRAEFYTSFNRIKGLRTFYDIARSGLMRSYVFSKDPAQFIDDYFNKTDIKEALSYGSAIGRMEDIEKSMTEEELSMPPCLFVNRTIIAENIRKGIFEAGYNGSEAVTVSRKGSSDAKVNCVRYKLSCRDEPVSLTYFDMMIADAVYTLMLYDRPVCAKNVFAVLTGNHNIVLSGNKKRAIDDSIRKMMNTVIEIDPCFQNRQGIAYDGYSVIREAFLPLKELAGPSRSGVFHPILKDVDINVPVLSRTEGRLTRRTKRSRRKVFPALYRFAEDLLQFYVFPNTHLNMEGEDRLLRKCPGRLEAYYANALTIRKRGNRDFALNMDRFLKELQCLETVFEHNGYHMIIHDCTGDHTGRVMIPKRADYTFENVILTHYLLRRISMLPSAKRFARRLNVLSATVRLYEDDDSGQSIFERLFDGVRDMRSMDKYVRKRMINNMIHSSNSIETILERMCYLGIISGYYFDPDSESVKLDPSRRPSGFTLTVQQIRDRNTEKYFTVEETTAPAIPDNDDKSYEIEYRNGRLQDDSTSRYIAFHPAQ